MPVQRSAETERSCSRGKPTEYSIWFSHNKPFYIIGRIFHLLVVHHHARTLLRPLGRLVAKPVQPRHYSPIPYLTKKGRGIAFIRENICTRDSVL